MMLTTAPMTGYSVPAVLHGAAGNSSPKQSGQKPRMSLSAVFLRSDAQFMGGRTGEPQGSSVLCRSATPFRSPTRIAAGWRLHTANRAHIMNELTLLSVEVRQHDGLFSLNDLTKAAIASGVKKDIRPNEWLSLDQTKGLAEILITENPASKPIVAKAGRYGGTYVCKELVYAYAMWISPSFHLKVIRAFDALHGQPVSQPNPLPKTQKIYLIGLTAEEMAGQRVLMTFNEDGASFSAKPIPGCYVLTLDQIARGVGIGQDLPFSPAQLAQVIEGASTRLHRLLMQQGRA